MKVILTGSTGMIGKEVLTQSINNASLAEIIVLSRRPLPPSYPTSPKIKTIIIEDFLSYPASVLQELSGAEACIWALGGIPSRFPDLATARKVNVDYALAAAKVFVETLSPQLSTGKKFRFLYGEIENKLVGLEAESPDKLSIYLPRPGSVIPPNNKLVTVLVKLTTSFYPAMKAEEFAAAMIDIAINGADEQALSHDVVQERGRKVLRGGV